MWAAGVYDLGLTDAQFWEKTPRQFDALWERHLDRLEREASNFGLLAVLYANAHRDEKKRPQPFRVDDFVQLRNSAIAKPAKDGHCPECQLHESIGHLAECKRGQSLLQYNLSQLNFFTKAYPTKPHG